MRTLVIAAMAIVAVAAMGGGYYYYLNQTKTAIVVMVDVTGGLKSTVDTSEVPQHIANTIAEWSETDIQFSIFSNFENNKVLNITIPAQFPLLGNPTRRTKQLQKGYQAVNTMLNGTVAADSGRDLSVIYVPMVKSLNALAVKNVHTKEAIFYTDAQENTDKFSMYHDTDLARLITKPKDVRAFFEKEVQIGSLTGITVYLIYNPPTPLAEKRFLLMANLWSKIFTAHGAKVIIGPNLTTN